MIRNSILLFIMLTVVVRADDVTSVKVGETEIKLPNPPGMVQLPENSSLEASFNAMTPPNCTVLKKSVPAEVLAHVNSPLPGAVTVSEILSKNDSAQMTFDADAFTHFEAQVTKKFPQGMALNDADSPHYEEIKKRVAQLEKDTGVSTNHEGGIVSQGVISKHPDNISVLMTRSYNLHASDHDEAQQVYVVISYIHVKDKLLMAVTVMSNDRLGPEDLDTLKDTVEKYEATLAQVNQAQTTAKSSS
jgi:hypothetical protein